MRLGEIRNILRVVLADNNTMTIDHEPIFGGQAQLVKNYGPLIAALDILAGQKWNDANYAEIESIKSEFGSDTKILQLPQMRFNQLNGYISSLNAKLPFYISVIEAMTENQDEKVINIKLPDNLQSLSNLSDINKQLEDILKRFNVDGSFEFKGFDKGSDWYVVIATGILSHQYLIACLQVAQEYLKARTEYFKSEQARLAYEASLVGSEKESSEDDYKEYQEKYLELLVKKEVKKAIENINGFKGQTEHELNTQLVIATKKLVKELGEGVEFHLSLNPPSYATETNGEFRIDYKKIREMLPQKDNSVKQLTSEKKDKSDEK